MLGVTFTQPVRLWLFVVTGGFLGRTLRYAVRFTNLGVLDRVAPKHSASPRHVVAVLIIGCIASAVSRSPGRSESSLCRGNGATVV